MKQLPIIHAKRILHADSRFPIEQLDLEFSNGATRTFERLRPSDSQTVMIAAMPNKHTVLLVREYAAGLNQYEIGLPKGRLEAGEDIIEGANRELREEVGFGAKRFDLVASLSLAPTYMGHKTQVLLARDLYAERLPGDEPEQLEVVEWRMDNLLDLVQREDCSEGRSIAALFILREMLLAGMYE